MSFSTLPRLSACIIGVVAISLALQVGVMVQPKRLLAEDQSCKLSAGRVENGQYTIYIEVSEAVATAPTATTYSASVADSGQSLHNTTTAAYLANDGKWYIPFRFDDEDSYHSEDDYSIVYGWSGPYADTSGAQANGAFCTGSSDPGVNWDATTYGLLSPSPDSDLTANPVQPTRNQSSGNGAPAAEINPCTTPGTETTESGEDWYDSPACARERCESTRNFPPDANDPNASGGPGAVYIQTFDSCTTLMQFIQTLLNFFLTIAAVIAGVMFLLSGLRIVTSSGNPAAVAEGREQLTNAIVGMILVALSYALINFLDNALNLIPGAGIDLLGVFRR